MAAKGQAVVQRIAKRRKMPLKKPVGFLVVVLPMSECVARVRMGWLLSGIVASALCLAVATALGKSFCGHEPAEITAKVHLGDDEGDVRRKRQSGNYEPIRIHFSYDDTVNTLFDSVQRGRLQNTVIPAVGNFLESSLSVIRATSPILLNRQCDGPSMCGRIVIPDDHLRGCDECNGNFSTCETRPGPGVDNTDLIIYVSANCTGNSGFASGRACRLESNMDRPIAGFINVCPEPFAAFPDDLNIRIELHEVIHVLAFDRDLFAWFRDENGDPRTARDQFGFPASAASEDTIRTMTYNDWFTRNGVISHNVTVLVTPNVVEQARIHYNCTDIVGVELENQGGGGTASAHWENRIMGNEGMTSGSIFFGLPFSKITFGILQDSGWYLPDYTKAEALAWGLNTGCTIPHGSCREYIKQQQWRGRSISPYCDSLNDNTRGCTVDHQFISACNLENISSIPSEFQYFDASPNHGGTLGIVDFCPLELPIQASRCTDPSNQPATNNAGQLYGANSRCFELGRDWTRTDGGVSGNSTNNAGCYEYVCTSSGVEIILEGVSFLCSCEGEEILVNITVNDVRYQGSYICPSFRSVCYDSEERSCLQSEPPPCYGRVTVPDPCASNPCDVNAICTRTFYNSNDFICTCLPFFTGDGFVCSEPPFSVRLLNSSPRVNGDELLIDFETTMSIVSAKCYLTGQRPRDCDTGHIRYTGLSVGSYVFRVRATSRLGEKAFVRRIVHVGESDDDDLCAVHLINEGVVVDGRSAALFFKGTKAVDSYLCRLRGNGMDTSFTFCRSPTRYEDLEVGDYRFQVLPVGCEKRKRLSVRFEVY